MDAKIVMMSAAEVGSKEKNNNKIVQTHVLNT